MTEKENNSEDKKNIKKVLVLSGGGIKGLDYIGVFKALEELKYLDNLNIFAGSSVGALMLALLTIGYNPDEMYEFIKKFNLDKIKSIDIVNFLKCFGLDDGIKIEHVLKRLIKAKGYNEEITLLELYKLTKKKLIFTTVCINTLDVIYLSHENYQDLQLYKAIRMSISIPWFYTPVEYKNKLYIDGGCVDNYPIQLFKDKLEEVLGIYLIDTKDYVEVIDNLETYTWRIIQCFMRGFTFNSKKGFENDTIEIDVGSINIINYEIDNNKKKEIYKIGYDSIINTLKN